MEINEPAKRKSGLEEDVNLKNPFLATHDFSIRWRTNKVNLGFTSPYDQQPGLVAAMLKQRLTDLHESLFAVFMFIGNGLTSRTKKNSVNQNISIIFG